MKSRDEIVALATGIIPLDNARMRELDDELLARANAFKDKPAAHAEWMLGTALGTLQTAARKLSEAIARDRENANVVERAMWRDEDIRVSFEQTFGESRTAECVCAYRQARHVFARTLEAYGALADWGILPSR